MSSKAHFESIVAEIGFAKSGNVYRSSNPKYDTVEISYDGLDVLADAVGDEIYTTLAQSIKDAGNSR